jgi:hypothetical protein
MGKTVNYCRLESDGEEVASSITFSTEDGKTCISFDAYPKFSYVHLRAFTAHPITQELILQLVENGVIERWA